MSESMQLSESMQQRHAGGVVNRMDRIGLAVVVLIFLGGLWLMVAPFLVGYQGRGSSWSNATINEFAVGAGVAALALATLIVFLAGIVRDLLCTVTVVAVDGPDD